MLSCFDFIRELTVPAMTIRLLLAFACSAFIGAEREARRRPAGLRTHIIICLGAAIAILTSQYLLLSLGLYTDVSRLGAHVIAGIGFIGAGTIIVTSSHRVSGLTTAAGLWTSAVVGIACGAGFVECAAAATFLVLFTETVLIKLEFRLFKKGRLRSLYIEYDDSGAIQAILDVFHSRSIDVAGLDVTCDERAGDNKLYCALVSIQESNKFDIAELIPDLTEIPNICSIEEL